MARQSYPTVPPEYADTDEGRRQYIELIARIVNAILEGKINSVIDVTLDANSATTSVSDRRLGPDSFIGFMPRSTNAAAALGGLYVSAQGKHTATLTHANDANTDKNFRLVIIG